MNRNEARREANDMLDNLKAVYGIEGLVNDMGGHWRVSMRFPYEPGDPFGEMQGWIDERERREHGSR